jgi:hypothetical protein
MEDFGGPVGEGFGICADDCDDGGLGAVAVDENCCYGGMFCILTFETFRRDIFSLCQLDALAICSKAGIWLP